MANIDQIQGLAAYLEAFVARDYDLVTNHSDQMYRLDYVAKDTGEVIRSIKHPCDRGDAAEVITLVHFIAKSHMEFIIANELETF